MLTFTWFRKLHSVHFPFRGLKSSSMEGSSLLFPNTKGAAVMSQVTVTRQCRAGHMIYWDMTGRVTLEGRLTQSGPCWLKPPACLTHGKHVVYHMSYQLIHVISSSSFVIWKSQIFFTLKPVLRGHCREGPPVLKDHIFLKEVSIFYFNWTCRQRLHKPVLRDHIFVPEKNDLLTFLSAVNLWWLLCVQTKLTVVTCGNCTA